MARKVKQPTIAPSETERQNAGINSTALATRLQWAAVALFFVASAWLARWSMIDFHQIAQSDYVHQHVAGTLIRTGMGHELYDVYAQGPVYARLVAGDHTGDLLFNHAPLTAVLAAPVSMLNLALGYRVWSISQFLLLVIACLIATRAAPWPSTTPRSLKWLAVGAGIATIGSLWTLLQGQGLGIPALGIALSYYALRKQRLGTAGLLIGMACAVGKPHLFLGVIAWIAGTRRWRLVTGLIAGIAVDTGLSVAAVGMEGVRGFISAAAQSSSLYPDSRQFGLTGLAAAFLGDGSPERYVGLGLSGIAFLLALSVGWRFGPDLLEGSFGAAVALSLLAAPHLLVHDLALLDPVWVWLVAIAYQRSSGDSKTDGGRCARRLAVAWLSVMLASGSDMSAWLSGPLAKLTPWTLALSAWTYWQIARTTRH